MVQAVTLAASPIAACGSFFANGSAYGDDSDLLTVHAEVHDDNGKVLSSVDTSAHAIPPSF